MLREKIMSILIGVCMFTVTLASCMGCASITQHPHKIIRTTTGDVIKKQNTFFPIQSFVMTRQSFRITTSICDEAGDCTQHVIFWIMTSSLVVYISSSRPRRKCAKHVSQTRMASSKRSLKCNPLASCVIANSRSVLSTGLCLYVFQHAHPIA